MTFHETNRKRSPVRQNAAIANSLVSPMNVVTESPPLSTVTTCQVAVRDDPKSSVLLTSQGMKVVEALRGLDWLVGDANAMVDNAP